MKAVIGGLAFVVVLAVAQTASAACEDAAAVAAARLEVDALCRCDEFDNHGQYVRCAAGVANDLADIGALPKNCKGAVVKCAARSTCGKPGFVTCCRTDKNGRTKCSTKKDASKCTAPNGGSACVGLLSSCCDACTESGCAGGATPTPAPTATQTPAPTETPPPPTPTPGSASRAFVIHVPNLLQ